ncbi:MAG: hypothetical protein WBG38_08705 [Nodosilinea sp.]
MKASRLLLLPLIVGLSTLSVACGPEEPEVDDGVMEGDTMEEPVVEPEGAE